MTLTSIQQSIYADAAMPKPSRELAHVLLFLADFVALGEHAEAPARIFGADGERGHVLVPCAGVLTLERVPRRPARPERDTDLEKQRHERDTREWAARESRANALLQIHKRRLKGLLYAAQDLMWLQDRGAQLPPAFAAHVGKLLDAFGVAWFAGAAHTEIWQCVHEWPGNAQVRGAKPWRTQAAPDDSGRRFP